MTQPAGSSVDRWNERYAGSEYLWDVGPNQFVERYLGGIAAGTAIDLGAGEGRNAVWLATRGWEDVAVDFSQVGLDKAARLAADRAVSERVTLVNADVLTWEPSAPVDLVVIAYLQIAPADRRLALEHASTWPRPGGRLFLVAHDRSNVEHGYGGPSDPDHCYDLDEVIASLRGLEIEAAEVARREVVTEDGPRTALDTIVMARRPAPQNEHP